MHCVVEKENKQDGIRSEAESPNRLSNLRLKQLSSTLLFTLSQLQKRGWGHFRNIQETAIWAMIVTDMA